METITNFTSHNYALLGQPENNLHIDETQALDQAAILEETGYRPTCGVLHAANLEPMQALRAIPDGPTRVAEGAIIGPYVADGQVMSGFALYRPVAEDSHSITNILGRCVRLGSNYSPEQPNAWRIQAHVEDRLVEPIPILEPRIINPARNAVTPVEQVWSVLTNSYFRRSNLQALEPYRDQMQLTISAAIERGEPLQLVLPTLPFKDQNPITTGQPVNAIDLGEHAMMAQLRDLIGSVAQVYEPGLEITLVSDGQVYREVFTNASEEQVAGYTQNVHQLLERYGIDGQVSIVDFADIIADDADFRSHERGVERVLFYQQSRRIIECLQALQRGMLVNCQFDNYTAVNIEHYRSVDTSDWPGDIRRQTANAARQYAAFLITACQRRSLESEYPQALRATVHPKDAAQLPVHLVNNRSVIFPYNGVPVVKEDDPSLRRSLRIMRLAQLLVSSEDYYRCHDEAGNTLYYQRLRARR